MTMSRLGPEDSCSFWKHIAVIINKWMATGSTCLKHSGLGDTESVCKLHQYSNQQKCSSVQ